MVAFPGFAVAAFLLLSQALSAVSWTWVSPIPLVVAHGPGSISSLMPSSLSALLPLLWTGTVRVVVVVVVVVAVLVMKHVVSLLPWVAFLHSFSPVARRRRRPPRGSGPS